MAVAVASYIAGGEVRPPIMYVSSFGCRDKCHMCKGSSFTVILSPELYCMKKKC